MFNKISIILSLGVGAYVFATAPRIVNINVNTQYTSSSSSTTSSPPGINLFNGSNVTVNYKVTCYDAKGTQTFQKTSLSLSAKNGKTHGGPLKCGNGSNPYKTYSNGTTLCGDTLTATASVCPENFQLCTFDQVKQTPYQDSYSEGYSNSGWVGSGFNFSVNSTWSNGYTSNSSTSWIDRNYDPNYLPFASVNPYASCNSGSFGSGTTQINCTYHYMYAPNFCCPQSGAEIPSYSCDVEIDPSTPTKGFLQSHQFKGNAPF